MPHPRRLALEGSQNLRDLGGYPAGEGRTQHDRFLRADGLHRLSLEAQEALDDLALIIDLRHGAEVEAEPNPLSARGLNYRNISLFAGLDPSQFTPDPSLPETEVLLELYRETLSRNGTVLVEILTALADAPQGRVLFHCTAGKDRTGLVAMLLLGLAGASREDIIADYALTETLIADLIADLSARITASGKDGAAYARKFLTSKPETMAACLDYIDLRFGSIARYLALHGLDAATAARLKARLLD